MSAGLHNIHYAAHRQLAVRLFDGGVSEHSRELTILQAQDAASLAAIEARFWAKVNRTDTCWLWTASTNGRGHHGVFSLHSTRRNQEHNNGLFFAHRVAWALAGRDCQRGLELCHHCDVSRCVRLDHLFVGTHADNMRDAATKGRMGPRRGGKQSAPLNNLRHAGQSLTANGSTSTEQSSAGTR